jgi:hypothetical protein
VGEVGVADHRAGSPIVTVVLVASVPEWVEVVVVELVRRLGVLGEVGAA